jgi:hypothetical protein
MAVNTTVNIKNLGNSKLSETLQLNPKSLILDQKLTVNRALSTPPLTPSSNSQPVTNPINFIKTSSINSTQSHKPTTVTVLLNDSHSNAKAAQANLINAPQVASIINQLRNQQMSIQITQPAQNQTQNQPLSQSPTSSPGKPNIIRRTQKSLFDM